MRFHFFLLFHIFSLHSACIPHLRNTCSSRSSLTLRSASLMLIMSTPIQQVILSFASRSQAVSFSYSGTYAYCRETLRLIRTEGKWKVICAMSADIPCRLVNSCPNDAGRQSLENAEIENILLRYCYDVYLMNTEDCLSLFWNGARRYHPNDDDTFSDVEIHVLKQRRENAPNPREIEIEEFSASAILKCLTTPWCQPKSVVLRFSPFVPCWLPAGQSHSDTADPE